MNLNYNYGDDYSVELTMGIFAIYGIVLLVMLVFGLIGYIFKSIGMYTIAKREGKEYPWLAFIPFARTYLQGELSGDVVLKKKSIKNPGIWLIVLPFLFNIVTSVLVMFFWALSFGQIFMALEYGYAYSYNDAIALIMGLIVAIIIFCIIGVAYQASYNVLHILVNKQIYQKFTSSNMAVAHAVLGIFIPLYEAICLFVMRNKNYNPGMAPQIHRPQPVTLIMPEEPIQYVSPSAAPESTVQPAAQEAASEPEVQPAAEPAAQAAASEPEVQPASQEPVSEPAAEPAAQEIVSEPAVQSDGEDETKTEH